MLPKVVAKNRTRIVIADDHTVLRESLAALLSTQPDFVVEGRASNGQEALAIVKENQPDVLLLDLFMPDGDGFEVLRTLDRAGSRVAAVVLTGSDNELDYAQVVKLGARGLVLKSDGPEKLFTAVRTVANGELAFSDELAQQVLTTMTAESRSTLVTPEGGLNTNVSASATASVFQSLILSVYCGAPASVLLVITYFRGTGRAPLSIQICQSVSAPRNARCSHSTPSTTPCPIC